MKTIMIVDDSLIMRINLKKILEKEGYQVIAEAANGNEAVEKYKKLRPDLVTMDITMPMRDGISALQEICETDPDACVVMISAMGQETKIIEAINKGAKHYIVKPLKENDVVRIVGSVMNHASEGPVNVCVSG